MDESIAVTSAGELKTPGPSGSSHGHRETRMHTPYAPVVFGLTHKTSPRERREMHQVCQNTASCPLPAKTGQTCLRQSITAKRGGMGKSRQ